MFKIGDKSFRQWRGLESCGLAFLLCLLLVPGAFAQSGKGGLVVKQTAAQSLTLITPSDPAFEGMIDTYFPGLSQEDGYQKSIRPFLVLVRNDAAQTAVAYAITWTLQYSNGSVGLPRQALFVNSPLMNRGATTYLIPGEIRLISPMFNVTPQDYRRFSSFGKMYPAGHFPPSQGLASVDGSVDGVVYKDGTFAGVDKTRILQRYVTARYAARDEVLAALHVISSAVPQATALQSLEQVLNRHVGWGAEANQGTLMAWYIRARGRSAQYLQAVLRNRGFTGLETLLQKLAGSGGANMSPSAFGERYQKLSANDPNILVP